MGVIRQPKKVVIADLRSGEQSTAPATDDESVTSGQATPVPPTTRTRTSSAISPAVIRRELGYKLRLKQGRRTKQRCENEKLLMTMYGLDEEDITGQDIAQETRSYFLDLMSMENEELLDQFINNEEPRYFSKEKITRKAKKITEDNFEPEDAFMKIGFNLRQALKKHPPMGMLEGIEEKINGTFITNPNSEFVAEDLSSFERLLLHALCAYNALNSYSFDFGGKRIVRVENPYSTFFLKNPSLVHYLNMRMPARES
eukprot:GFUD01008734.1.p1 GENE.GFUD01008734.1~~GFUD01008734.1.p1  ORF type:complete len:257 (+),score=82.78 GFUD01008734.1:83-853(+)